MTLRTRGSRGAILAAVLFFVPHGVSAFCTSNPGPWNLADQPIPVYLNNNVDDLICPNSNCSSFNEIRRSTEITLDEFYDSSSARLRLRYVGPTNEGIGAVMPKAIHVFAAANCMDAPGVAAWGDTNGDGKTDFGKVRMCANFRGQPVAWDSFPDFSSTFNLSWQGVLAHEVGHTLAFDHPSVCGQSFKSIMGTTTGSSHHAHHLYKDDIDGYQNNYGYRDRGVSLKQSATALNWSDGPAPPGANPFSDVPFALSRLSACGASAPATFVSFPLDTIPRLVSLWRYAGGWQLRPGPWFAATNYHTGTACRDDTHVGVAWLGGYENETGLQSVLLSTTTDAGNSWSVQFLATGTDRTRNAGVDAAYDPQSGHYVVLWRDNLDRITSKVAAPGAPIRNYRVSSGGGTYLRASDSPSIACGPVSAVGPENCIVAWPDVGWNRTLRWAHARVDTSDGTPQLILGQVRGQGYIIFGMPSVAYWSDGEFPWALVFHQGGPVAYSLRKRADANAVWQDERSMAAGNKIVSPVAGSRLGPQTPEDDVIVYWLYSLFTSSSVP